MTVIKFFYPSKGNLIADAIEHFGSYGSDEDLIEIQGLLTDAEKQYDSVLGHLTAEEVFKRFKEDFERRS